MGQVYHSLPIYVTLKSRITTQNLSTALGSVGFSLLHLGFQFLFSLQCILGAHLLIVQLQPGRAVRLCLKCRYKNVWYVPSRLDARKLADCLNEKIKDHLEQIKIQRSVQIKNVEKIGEIPSQSQWKSQKLEKNTDFWNGRGWRDNRYSILKLRSWKNTERRGIVSIPLWKTDVSETSPASK